MKRLNNRRVRESLRRRSAIEKVARGNKSTYFLIESAIASVETNPIVRMMALVGAFVAFAIPLWQIYLEIPKRRAEADARAWQLLTAPAVGNTGKGEAIEYILGRGISIEGVDLSCRTMSGGTQDNESCLGSGPIDFRPAA